MINIDSTTNSILEELNISHSELESLFDYIFERKIKSRQEITNILGPYTISKSNSDNNCVICIDNIKAKQHQRILECKHTFHRKCIDKWFEIKDECPVCRFSYFTPSD